MGVLMSSDQAGYSRVRLMNRTPDLFLVQHHAERFRSLVVVLTSKMNNS
jgi:hypothetical protein